MAAKVHTELPSMNDIDKGKMFVCPYNQYHKITAKHLPIHLAKCRKQYTGTAYRVCPFNARHEFPAAEYDYHISSCPDKGRMEKELTRSTTFAPNVPPVRYEEEEFNPVEDWDQEADHMHFSMGASAGDVGKDAYDEVEQHNYLVEASSNTWQRTSTDLSGLSKAQKKNMKRAQKRMDNKLKESEAGNYDDDDDDDDDDDNHDNNDARLTEGQKESKLSLIAKEYAIPGRPYSRDAFVDWVSILNQYCQRSRMNQPKYGEASNPGGGFGAYVIVGTEKFLANSYSKTKKEAKHFAAREALLGLKIAVSSPDPCKAAQMGTNYRAREVQQQAMLLRNTMAPEQRVIPGFNPVSAPETSVSARETSVSATTKQMAGMSIQKNDEDWKVVGKKRTERSSVPSMKLAGIGRGRARR